MSTTIEVSDKTVFNMLNSFDIFISKSIERSFSFLYSFTKDFFFQTLEITIVCVILIFFFHQIVMFDLFLDIII